MGTSLRTDGSSKKQILLSSCVFMGLGHILYLKQYIKGILFALIEVLMLIASPKLLNMFKDMIEISRWYPYIRPATFRLVDGIMAIFVVAIFVIAYVVSVKSALSSYQDFCLEGRCKSNKEAMQGAVGKAFPLLGLSPALILVIFFVIVPLIFSITVGFTNWSLPDHLTPGAPVNWVGIENYIDMFGGSSQWSSAFGRVALWTVIWGFVATGTCYFGGMLLATVLYEAKLKITPVFRAILILPYAVPSILTVKVWQNMLNGSTGTINKTLRELGLITQNINWLNDTTLVKFVCIGVNMWVGIPYFMLLITGQMTAISADIYEAATIDGANKAQVFKSITLPLVIYQTAPLIIMSFTHNINNFGAIYFLTGGDPKVQDTTITGAGATDLLVTWIYKLTMNELKYCKASVLAMLVFIVMAPFAIWNFRNTKSYKEGEL
ncbi:MAG: sugar ABC transporter permease [Lachnospiraceae bacterium]|nr:sugar ABC transporter permease [Lachnospiraceae bacterium]